MGRAKILSEIIDTKDKGNTVCKNAKGKKMNNERIKDILIKFVSKYKIKSMVLFGSRAEGTNTDQSDVDLIIEFLIPVSLITLSQIQLDMEKALGLNVDIVHGPIREDDMLEIGKEIVP